ncbi:MAG TPA: serine hydrolase [Vicinamibacterales bacterium]|nr:serine hydrolase [Vicinamibacterales bacterium]
MTARGMRLLICATALLSAAASCGNDSPTSPSGNLTPVVVSTDWPVASVNDAGLDADRLRDLLMRIRRGDYGHITSLLIARNGSLAVEEYFDGFSGGSRHTMQSVTKSVTSLLIGLASDRGRLRLEDPATQFFPSYAPIANLDSRKAALTVGDLLSMRSGFDWNESTYSGSPLQGMNDCGCDWLRWVLDWRMRDVPGGRWEYISGNTILLGGIVGAASGQRMDLFAASELFEPLGISDVFWFRGLPDGLPHSGGGLNMRPRDMIKLGQMVLDDGRWRGRQVVSSAWIRQSTARVQPNAAVWSGHSFDYAYGWWLTPSSFGDVITASGARGQFIFVVPGAKLVVTMTGENNDGLWVSGISTLFSHVLPGVR